MSSGSATSSVQASGEFAAHATLWSEGRNSLSAAAASASAAAFASAALTSRAATFPAAIAGAYGRYSTGFVWSRTRRFCIGLTWLKAVGIRRPRGTLNVL